ncbi:cAMP-dependent protein kinase types I and II, regulatory subunit [Pseudoloma neurophilia]|uniref:cAMP-dependent protein kinase types I and II, regulatory subunit n=1 Tax=Pseudoloma neurophilia TaxID=146866 RepID=A0A0R0LVY8_9MICR|nr:cAMP-dependent protein kinase types I and II, regulatory subunit [Pseudoloma neurophilia]
MCKLSMEKKNEIIQKFLLKLPKEVRESSLDDILYLYNKKIVENEKKIALLAAKCPENQPEPSMIMNEKFCEKILEELLQNFVEFRLLAITPHSRTENISFNKRKPIKNLSNYGNTKIVPKTDQQIKMFSKIFENSIFSVLTLRQKSRFIENLRPYKTQSNEIIIRKGEESQKLFFLEKGHFCLLLEENEYKKDEIRPARRIIFENRNMIEIDLPEHTITGEIALLHRIPRTATIISKTRGLVWYLKRSTYMTIRLFDEEQKWRTFIDNMERKGFAKGYLAGNSQGTVFHSGTHVRLVKCPECCQFFEECCNFSKNSKKIPHEPTHLFFNSFKAQISINGEEVVVHGNSLIETHFIAISEMEGFIVPRMVKK